MKPRTFTRKSAIPIILTMFLLILVPITITSAEVTELNVNPQVVVQGETLSISGEASDGDVWIDSSFEISLPVSGGEYYGEFIDIDFPEGEKEFSVRAENIKNLRVSIPKAKFGLTVTVTCDGETLKVTAPIIGTILEEPLKIIDDVVKFSFQLPRDTNLGPMNIEGKKDVKIEGDAAEDATSVNLNIATSVERPTEPNGNFALPIDTSGIPTGAFRIDAGKMSRTVLITSTLPGISLSADKPSITVGDTTILTAQLKNQSENILQDGIFIDFDTTAGTLSERRVMTDASGRASTTLTSTTPGTANVRAYCDDIKSNDVSIEIIASSTPSSNGGGSAAPETTPTHTPATAENVTSNETATPTPTLIPTPTPASTTTTAPQTTVIENETSDKTPGPTPRNETNQTPQETTEPVSIPGFGFEAIGCIAIAALIMVIMKKVLVYR